MKRRSDLRVMKQLVAIRAVQQRGAEGRLAAADARLNALRTEEEGAVSALGEVHAAWLDATSGPRLDLQSASGWSTMVRRGLEDVAQATSRVAQADRRKQLRRGELVAAMARADAAGTVERRVRKAIVRRDEEAALHDLADRFAQRRPAP